MGRELEIFTFGDLLYYFPFRYIDRSHLSQVSNIDVESTYVVLRGVIDKMQTLTTGRSVRLTARFYDGTGYMELVWFQGIKWVKEMLRPDIEYLVMGRPSYYGGMVQMAHPDIEPYDEEHISHRHVPIYNTTEKLKAKSINPKTIGKLVSTLLGQVKGEVHDTLPEDVVLKYRLMDRETALRNVHFPEDEQRLGQALFRMKFEELFFLQLDYQFSRVARQLYSTGRVFSVVGEHFNRFYAERLPFQLTGAQKRVVKEIRSDMRSGRQMNRLLQGDVGSGKTLVALLSMLIALDNGCQACLMAPTEILAAQHYATFCRMLEGLDIGVELITGSLKASQKKKIKERLASGEIDILIGTHALLEGNVMFQNLGYVVIDEQHRFGVQQRAKLWAKSTIPPHILVMTATPIPRTLAMTLYADLECSVIDELPPGRQSVRTLHATDAKRLAMFGFLRKEIAKGRQAYVVYPLITESENLDLKALEEGVYALSREFPLPDYRLSVLHGKMTAEEKAFEMDRFKRGETHIMVSTTVIEVGVDVPNATVMVIENAERFGLSQLHQLRGRVGRGSEQSYCILMTKERLTKSGKERIATMVETCDGFKIAEADLKLRGPGDLQGLQQSGILELKLADIVADEALVCATRDEVKQLLDLDPDLAQPVHRILRQRMQQRKNRPQWEKIS